MPGLVNGVTYTVSVFAEAGPADAQKRTRAGYAVPSVQTVVPSDVLIVGRAEYRADRNEYRVNGTALDTTQNTVTIKTSAGATGGTAPVGAHGAWTFSQRTNVPLPAGATLTITSSSGANLAGVAITRR